MLAYRDFAFQQQRPSRRRRDPGVQAEKRLSASLRAMEARDCRCRLICRPFCQWPEHRLCECLPVRTMLALRLANHPVEYPCKHCTGKCDCHGWYGEPCEHVLAAVHTITLHRWAELLLEHDWESYYERPLPDRWDVATTPAAQVGLFTDRVKEHLALKHPQDVYSDTHFGLEVYHNQGNGSDMFDGSLVMGRNA